MPYSELSSDIEQTILVDPFKIYMMNAYSIHTGTYAEKDSNRTFIRLEFSKLDFDRSGNSINPYFEQEKFKGVYPFKYKKRPISTDLILPAKIFEKKPIYNTMYQVDTLSEKQLKELAVELKYSWLESSKKMVFWEGELLKGVLEYKENNSQLEFLFFHLLDENNTNLLAYALKKLKEKADSTSVIFIENENNYLLHYDFLKASKIAKLDYSVKWSTKLFPKEEDLFLRPYRNILRDKDLLRQRGFSERAEKIDLWDLKNHPPLDTLTPPKN